MKLTGVVWKPRFVNKLATKHGVSTGETEQVLFGQSLYRFMKSGKVRGEDVYAAFGQTLEGRYLVVVFIRKIGGIALPVSARAMSPAERRYYDKQR